jgi:hypothetical protein
MMAQHTLKQSEAHLRRLGGGITLIFGFASTGGGELINDELLDDEAAACVGDFLSGAIFFELKHKEERYKAFMKKIGIEQLVH